MSRGAQTFSQSDVTKAIKAAVKAGLEVQRFEIDRDGRIVVVASKAEVVSRADVSRTDPWDTVR